MKLKGMMSVLIVEMISLGKPYLTSNTVNEANTGELPIFYVSMKIIKNLRYLLVKKPLNFFKTSITLSIYSGSSSSSCLLSKPAVSVESTLIAFSLSGTKKWTTTVTIATKAAKIYKNCLVVTKGLSLGVE